MPRSAQRRRKGGLDHHLSLLVLRSAWGGAWGRTIPISPALRYSGFATPPPVAIAERDVVSPLKITRKHHRQNPDEILRFGTYAFLAEITFNGVLGILVLADPCMCMCSTFASFPTMTPTQGIGIDRAVALHALSGKKPPRRVIVRQSVSLELQWHRRHRQHSIRILSVLPR